jgi:hypothetical protein
MGGSMAFTRKQFATALCHAVGNTSPSDATLDFVIGWTVAETDTNSGATFNLLNTTWDMEVVGQTHFNSVGVKNYPDFDTGITATVRTLQDGDYPSLLVLLRTNVPQITNDPPLGIQAELSTWCGGCGYGEGFVSLGVSHAKDEFYYGSEPMTQPTDIQIAEAQKCWSAVFTAIGQTPPVTGTGIYTSWLSDWINFGRQYGPPLTHEFQSVDWNENTITVQEFAHARCEWNGAPSWYGASGKLN